MLFHIMSNFEEFMLCFSRLKTFVCLNSWYKKNVLQWTEETLLKIIQATDRRQYFLLWRRYECLHFFLSLSSTLSWLWRVILSGNMNPMMLLRQPLLKLFVSPTVCAEPQPRLLPEWLVTYFSSGIWFDEAKYSKYLIFLAPWWVTLASFTHSVSRAGGS